MDHIAQTQSLSQQTMSQQTLPDIPQETLDQLILTPEAKAHYSQENEIKRLLIERETYKRAYEEQQKKIDEFANQWVDVLSTPVEVRKTTYYDKNDKNDTERVSRNYLQLRDFINQNVSKYYYIDQ